MGSHLGLDLERQLVDHAQLAHADAKGLPEMRVGLWGDLKQGAVGQHHLQPHSLRERDGWAGGGARHSGPEGVATVALAVQQAVSASVRGCMRVQLLSTVSA